MGKEEGEKSMSPMMSKISLLDPMLFWCHNPLSIRDAGAGGARRFSRGGTCKEALVGRYSSMDPPMLKSIFRYDNIMRSMVERFCIP